MASPWAPPRSIVATQHFRINLANGPGLLWTFLWPAPYNEAMGNEKKGNRPDIVAATRGGDWAQAMDGEGPPAHATRKEADYWLQIYTEILAMEEKVLRRIETLMSTQSVEARREVELTNVPVVVAQVERFRQRRGYWEARTIELDGHEPVKLTPGARKAPASPAKRLKKRK